MSDSIKGKTVFILTYEHKYGIDVDVFSSEENANGTIKERIFYWLGDLEEEDQLEVETAFRNMAFWSAVRVYCDLTSEQFEVRATTIL